MLLTVLVLGFIVLSLAGEVEHTGYKPKDEYLQLNGLDYRVVLMETAARHQFLIKVDHRRKEYFNGRGIFLGGTHLFKLYQNIFGIYYDDYPLDTLKIPELDRLADDPLSAVDAKVRHSIIPVTPKLDVESPDEIMVYYSLSNGNCIRGKYSFVSNGQHYEKKDADAVVDNKFCAVKT